MLVISAPPTLYSSPTALSFPATATISRATSCTWTRCTNGNPSPGTRIGRPCSRRAKNTGSRLASGVLGPTVWVTRREVAGNPSVRWSSRQVVLAGDLAGPVGLARVGVVRGMAGEVLLDGLDEAALVDRHRAGEHELLDPPAEQLDQRDEVLDLVGGVVVDDVELVAVRFEHLARARRAWRRSPCRRRAPSGSGATWLFMTVRSKPRRASSNTRCSPM